MVRSRHAHRLSGERSVTGPRKLLVIGLNFSPETTGIAPYTAGMVRGLREKFEVDVLTTYSHYPGWEFDPPNPPWRSRAMSEEAEVTRLRHYLPADPSGLTRILSEASFAARVAFARKARPDGVVSVTPGLLPAAVGGLLARRWHVPFGVVVQDLYSRAFAELDLFGGRLNSITHRFEASVLRSAHGVVCIHSKMAETIIEKYGVESSRVRDIPNWTHVGSPSSDARTMRRRLGWQDDEVVVLHAGNMGAKQGLEHVVEAARLVEQPGAVRFVAMGGGARRQHLEELSRDVPQFTIMDGVAESDFMDVLAAADVLLLHERPGLQEMCAPSKLTSYFAAGRPVLAVTETDSAASIEMQRSEAGEVVTPGLLAHYVEASLRLAQRPHEVPTRSQAYAAANLDERAALAAYRGWVTELLR